MFREDPLTADYPSRNARQEEEEAAQKIAHNYADPPTFLWAPAGRALLQQGSLPVKLLVIAACPAACALLTASPLLGQALGSMVMDEVALTGNAALPSLSDRSCWLHTLTPTAAGPGGAPARESGTHGDAGAPAAGRDAAGAPAGAIDAGGAGGVPGRRAGDGGGNETPPLDDGGACAGGVDTLVAVCQYDVASARAFAVARGLLSSVKPRRVIVLGDIAVRDFLGPGDPTEEALPFVLPTENTGSASSWHGVPLLPVGNLVTGLPAAVFSRLRATGIPADVLVSISDGASVDGALIQKLAEALKALLTSAGGPLLAGTAQNPREIAAACRAAAARRVRDGRGAVYA